MREDSDFLQLLHTDYNTLLKELQPLLRFAVNKICNSYSLTNLVPELLSLVNEELLTNKFDKIKQTYSGQVKLTTYIVTVVTNFCKDEIKSERRRTARLKDLDLESELYSTSSSEAKLLIEEEIKRLNFIISLSKYPVRLNTCLKIFANLELSHDEINNTVKEISEKSDVTTISSELLNFNENEQARFYLLANLLSQFDTHEMLGDSLRRWCDRKIIDIIEVLNGNPQRKNYTKDSLRILIEYYFSDKMSESA